MLNSFKQFLREFLGISPELFSNLTSSAITIIILWIIYKVTVRFLLNKLEEPKTVYKWRKFSLYGIVTIGFIILSKIWFGAFTGLSTYLGLLSAGIAIALQDSIVNIAAWLFITIRQPFKVGDRIQISSIAGDVIDIRIFQFSVVEIRNWVDADQSTGRIIHIPNGLVFKEALMNYTAGFEYIWEEIPVLITFESNWKKAKEILNDVVNRHAEKFSTEAEKQIRRAAQKFMIYYSKLTPIVYTNVKDSGVLLTIRVLSNVRKRRSLQEVIWEDIMEEFAKHNDIDLAYPTIRYFNNITEGKPGMK